MHELSITTDMVEAVSARVAGLGSPKIKRIVLEIGSLTAVFPDAIRFCFELCARDTPAESATLEIIEVPAAGTCRRCGEKIESREPVFVCGCGGADISWKQGQELKILELEIE